MTNSEDINKNSKENQNKNLQENPKEIFKPEEKSFKEQRIRELTMIYYSQPEIKKTMFKFSQNRETIPKYFEGFGKRPDNFQYEGDILEQVKKGATSFHCSQELWSDPLEISTEMSRKELDEIRIGWDLLLDIDSPYLEYSKIYTGFLINTLEFYGIKNYRVKFSGSKGFHVIIPWKAFPEQIYNQKTKDMFPEWPKIICQYLAEIIQPKLAEEILKNEDLKQIAEKTGRLTKELAFRECKSCNRPATTKDLVTWICPACKIEKIFIQKNRRIPKCSECSRTTIEKSRKEIFVCEYCNISSDKNQELFEKRERIATEKLIDADLILVASRHLFRMPYSLHEKTALSSIVLDKEEIKNFQITDAKPFKTAIKDFYPNAQKDEAKNLLLQALDWYEQKQKEEKSIQETKQNLPAIKSKSDYKKVVIESPSEDIFPPQIKLLLKGVKQDGRKRALSILLAFFTSLGAADSYIEKKINEWNEKNYNPLKKGYIMSQLSWYRRNPTRLPPNFSNSIYRELGVDFPDKLSMQTKNPVSYAIKKYFRMQPPH